MKENKRKSKGKQKKVRNMLLINHIKLKIEYLKINKIYNHNSTGNFLKT